MEETCGFISQKKVGHDQSSDYTSAIRHNGFY